jgi:hypothetical protein
MDHGPRQHVCEEHRQADELAGRIALLLGRSSISDDEALLGVVIAKVTAVWLSASPARNPP